MAKSNAAAAVNVQPKAALASRAAFNVRGTFSPNDTGVVGDIARGWDAYDNPAVVAAREATHARLEAECAAYFIAEMAKK